MRRFLFGCVALLVVGVAGGAAVAWQRMHEPFKGYGGAEQSVEIPSGASPLGIGDRLVGAGLVRDPYVFRAALWWTGSARILKAGSYRFEAPASVLDILGSIARGDVDAVRITFPEGLIIGEMADIFAAHGLGTAADFAAAARQRALVADLDPAARDLEGYLFPATYAVTRQATAPDLVAMMVRRFREAYTSELQESAAGQGLSTRQLLALASLVEKETARPEERPLVAAVYRNRMRIGMGMQADPTVVYALRLAGRYTGNLRRDDLRFDSPYNTYRYRGLPPGPIASPGLASIEAALAPADVPYLYFVSRNDGSHVFAKTLREHNANVNEFQVRYFQRGRRAAQRQ
jgi:UPF0755 protein